MVAKKARKQAAVKPARDEPTTFERLQAARSRRLALDRNEAELVAVARAEGLSWAVIGGALGVSAQAANQAAMRRARRDAGRPTETR